MGKLMNTTLMEPPNTMSTPSPGKNMLNLPCDTSEGGDAHAENADDDADQTCLIHDVPRSSVRKCGFAFAHPWRTQLLEGTSTGRASGLLEGWREEAS